MIKINLLDFREEKIRLRIQAQIMGSCLLVCVTLGIIGALVSLQGKEVERLSAVKARKNKELASLRPVRLKVAKSKKMRKRLETIVATIRDLKKNKKEPARLFDEMLNRRIPFGELWLDRLVEKKEGIVLEGYSFLDRGISLFMKSLENMGVFDDVILEYIRQKELKKRKVKKFKIICLRSGALYTRETWRQAALR